MSLLEKALQECDYKFAALIIVYGLLKVINVVDKLLTASRYKQLLEFRNKLFLFKGKFGNRPVWPTIEPKTIPIKDRSRTFLSTGHFREGLIKFHINNSPPS